jgi:hypothetical protein
MPYVNKMLQLIINLMIHDTSFNKIAFDWSKMFLMPKHLFYSLSYTTTMFNTIKKMIKNVFSS